MNVAKLWDSRQASDWREALNSYWDNPSVQGNQAIEHYMDELDIEVVREFDVAAWYDFLERYFRWKFNKSQWLSRRLEDLASNDCKKLLEIKVALFSLEDYELADIQRTLKMVSSPRIKGLGYPGASGLLSVLFPNWFGTVDRFVVEALQQIETLPERLRIMQIDPREISERDSVLLIDVMRRKANRLNGVFGTTEWTPRRIDMILWTLRDGRGCS